MKAILVLAAANTLIIVGMLQINDWTSAGRWLLTAWFLITIGALAIAASSDLIAAVIKVLNRQQYEVRAAEQARKEFGKEEING